jgi:hypothetical protein
MMRTTAKLTGVRDTIGPETDLMISVRDRRGMHPEHRIS